MWLQTLCKEFDFAKEPRAVQPKESFLQILGVGALKGLHFQINLHTSLLHNIQKGLLPLSLTYDDFIGAQTQLRQTKRQLFT